MQTFLSNPSFAAPAVDLDDKRLNNQPNEVKPLIRAVTGESTAWANHPAAIMWRRVTGAAVHQRAEEVARRSQGCGASGDGAMTRTALVAPAVDRVG